MRCQYCNCTESKVIDSRPTEDGAIRRRRAEARAAKEEGEEPFRVDYAEVLAERLQRELGRRVTIADGKRKKTITFCYEDNEDLDRFLRRLVGDAFMDEE